MLIGVVRGMHRIRIIVTRGSGCRSSVMKVWILGMVIHHRGWASVAVMLIAGGWHVTSGGNGPTRVHRRHSCGGSYRGPYGTAIGLYFTTRSRWMITVGAFHGGILAVDYFMEASMLTVLQISQKEPPSWSENTRNRTRTSLAHFSALFRPPRT